MDVSGVEGATKSMKVAELGKSGDLSAVPAAIEDGDGGMTDFTEGKEWDASSTAAPAADGDPTVAPATGGDTSPTTAQAAVADLAVVTHGFVGLALAVLAHAVFFLKR